MSDSGSNHFRIPASDEPRLWDRQFIIIAAVVSLHSGTRSRRISMAAVGVAVGVAEEDTPNWLRPDEMDSSWLGEQLKAAFELSDDEVERTMAMVSGRPNFLKTTQMLRARRDKHWDMWIKLTKKMAAVFSTADDVDTWPLLPLRSA